MQNFADAATGSNKKLMRRPLLGKNPTQFKSATNNQTYTRTGKIVNTDFVKPTGVAYSVPPKSSVTGYDIFKPFSAIIDKKLSEKGLVSPSSMADKAKLFYNHIVAAKGFNGSKPVNFEGVDHADATADQDVIDQMLTYFQSLVSGTQPNGAPLSTQDQKISADAKAVVNDLTAKVAASGLTPQDAAAAGATNVTTVPAQSTPLLQQTWVKLAIAAVIVYVIIKFVF